MMLSAFLHSMLVVFMAGLTVCILLAVAIFLVEFIMMKTHVYRYKRKSNKKYEMHKRRDWRKV